MFTSFKFKFLLFSFCLIVSFGLSSNVEASAHHHFYGGGYGGYNGYGFMRPLMNPWFGYRNYGYPGYCYRHHHGHHYGWYYRRPFWY